MKQYLNLIEKILEEGIDRSIEPNGKKSIFGHQMHFDLQKVFFSNNKKVHLKSIIHELIWFIAGSTNIKYLKIMGFQFGMNGQMKMVILGVSMALNGDLGLIPMVVQWIR